jgi:hypothetical protein
MEEGREPKMTMQHVKERSAKATTNTSETQDPGTGLGSQSPALTYA